MLIEAMVQNVTLELAGQVQTMLPLYKYDITKA